MKKLLLFFFFSCLFFEAVAGPSLSYGNWRWRNDDGSETNATWKGAENQEVEIISADEMLRLRIKIASQAASGLDYTFTNRIENQIGYSRSADGPFTRISATEINSEHFVLASSDDVQGGAATTEQLTPGVGGNFRAGQVLDSSTPQGALVFYNESIMKEFEWVLKPTAFAQEGRYFFKISDESIGQPGTLPSVLYTTSPQDKPIAGYLNGLQFDGVNDYVEIPSQPSNQFNSETEFTVSLWFKANSMAIAGLFNRPSGGGDMQFWLTAADGKFTYGIDKHGHGWTWIGTETAYKVGEWVQVTTVRRNVNGQRKMEIYADGVLVGSGTVNYTSSASNAPIRIGTYMNADGGFANGQIDNVSLWARALSAAEIKTLGATTLNGNEAGLAGYWRFDETTGTIAYDATSNANHGTLKNMDLATARVVSTAGDIKTYENVVYSGKLAGSDPTGKPLSYSLVTAPANGTILLHSNGNFTYTPAADVAGTDVFSYSVSNGIDVSNTATVNVTIVAVNKAPIPAVAELPTITAECAVTVTAPTANDDNDGVITGATTDPVQYTTQGNYTITWTYRDSEGLTSTQTQQVIIKDVTKPVFAAVTSINQNNDADKCGAVVTYTMPAATDNCSSEGKKVLLIWDEINTNTTNLKNALTAAGLDVVLSATSETGYDGTNPSLTGFDAVIHLNGTTYTAAMPAAGQTALLDFVVNKGGTYITNEWSAYEIGSMALMRDILVLERTGNGFTGGVTYSVVASQVGHPILQDIPASFNLPSAGANTGGTRTYSANQPIALMTSPHGVAVAVREFSNGGRAVGFQHAGNYNGSAVLSDANAQKLYLNAVKYAGSRNSALTITQTAGLPSGVLFPIGKTTNTFTATDAAGNTSTISFDVTITDTQKPTVVTKDLTLELDATGKATITAADINNGSTDNCAIPADGYSLDITNFTCEDIGPKTVTLTVTDENGNSQSATATVTIVDAIKPTITAPSNVTVNTDPGKNTASGVVLGTPATADNCSGASIINNAPATFPLGNTTVTWTATDAAGNTATATQVVTVEDKESPVPTIAMLPTITGQCAATAAAAPTATDNVSGTVSATTTDPLAYAEQGAYTITWTYTDAAGNTSTQTQQVIVKDDTAPVVKTKPVTIALDVDGKAGIVASDVNNGSTDNCGIASYKLDIEAFGCSNIGDNIVTLTVTDVNGNQAAATAIITVVDTTKPVAAGKGITVVLGADGKATITAADIDNNSSDNCSIASVTLSKYSFDCSNIGANDVTLTVTDAGGNQSTATATVTVLDNLAPIVRIRDITVQLDAEGKAAITATQINNGSSDNCGIETLSLDKTTFDCSQTGKNTVTLTVTDKYGNAASATATVTIVENIAPVAVTRNIAVALDAEGKAAITADQINNGSSDNCGIESITLDKTSFNCSDLGQNTVTLTVTDKSGNASTATAIVSVEDRMAPTAIARNLTVQLDANGKASITAAQLNNGSSDNCSEVTLSLDKTSFGCEDLGENTVTLTVTDKSGNQSMATAIVTVEDKVAPVVIVQHITIQLDASGTASITAADINKGSSDNCGIATVALSRTTFDCSHVGVNDVVLTVTDVNGNSATATAKVTVEDKFKPNAVARNITLYLNASGTASVTAADIDGGSQDVCGEITLSLDKTTFDCTNIGANDVTLTVTDASGNQSTATTTVTVLDHLAPVVRTRNVTVQLDVEGKATITAEQINDNSSDNCGIATIALDKTVFECSQTGANTVILTVTDKFGNSASAPAIVTVVENIAPVVLTRNITVSLDATGKATITADQIDNGSSDNCGIATIELSKTDFGCENLGENTVTLTVTDKSGNKASATATITVEDNNAPLAITRNLTVQVDANGKASITAAQLNNGSADNCSIETLSLDKASFSCEDLGENTVTLTVTDKSGNQSRATAIVTVEDKVAPVVIVQHITIQLDASGTASITAADINKGSSDNCGIA
ncbi:HYR domain-containing protein, partial [Pontibacter amylolyticus]|uniref:HYR domain-containing protein n=1 Tax=Pontibacter amylolyticus TaxID=1424080 RepID=UPI00166E91E7